MSTKISARQRKELKQYRERMAAKVPRASQMQNDGVEDAGLLAIGLFAGLVMVGLVAVAACVITGVI